MHFIGKILALHILAALVSLPSFQLGLEISKSSPISDGLEISKSSHSSKEYLLELINKYLKFTERVCHEKVL